MVVYSHQRKLLSVREYFCAVVHVSLNIRVQIVQTHAAEQQSALPCRPVVVTTTRQKHTGKDDSSCLEPCQFMTSFTRPKTNTQTFTNILPLYFVVWL